MFLTYRSVAIVGAPPARSTAAGPASYAESASSERRGARWRALARWRARRL